MDAWAGFSGVSLTTHKAFSTMLGEPLTLGQFQGEETHYQETHHQITHTGDQPLFQAPSGGPEDSSISIPYCDKSFQLGQLSFSLSRTDRLTRDSNRGKKMHRAGGMSDIPSFKVGLIHVCHKPCVTLAGSLESLIY